MAERYIFILWNKALFCKNRIMDDLKKDFNIDKYFYVKWSDKLFAKNIKAFYGTKTNNIDEKIKNIGKGKFLVILITDNNPFYDYRKTYNNQEKVNTKIYDKKHLYRKWTGGQFRIHSSQDEKETKHDLTILFGNNYDKLIASIDNNSIKRIDTIGAYNFSSMDNFKICLSNIDNSCTYVRNNKIIVLTFCQKDIESVLFNLDEVIIDDNRYTLRIYGEKDGNLPSSFLDKLDEKMVSDFISIENSYYNYIKTNILSDYKVNDFFNKYKLDSNMHSVDTNRPCAKIKFIEKIKYFIKYIICYITYKD